MKLCMRTRTPCLIAQPGPLLGERPLTVASPLVPQRSSSCLGSHPMSGDRSTKPGIRPKPRGKSGLEHQACSQTQDGQPFHRQAVKKPFILPSAIWARTKAGVRPTHPGPWALSPGQLGGRPGAHTATPHSDTVDFTELSGRHAPPCKGLTRSPYRAPAQQPQAQRVFKKTNNPPHCNKSPTFNIQRFFIMKVQTSDFSWGEKQLRIWSYWAYSPA